HVLPALLDYVDIGDSKFGHLLFHNAAHALRRLNRSDMFRLLGEGNGQGSRPGSDIQDAGVLAYIRLPYGLVNAASLLSAHVPESESALPALPDTGAVPARAACPVLLHLALPNEVPVDILGVYHKSACQFNQELS